MDLIIYGGKMLGNAKITREEFEAHKKSVLMRCDKMDELGFVPEEIYSAEKIHMDKTENQGEILVGENADGRTAFIYSSEKASLVTYSYDESGRRTKCEYTDNRAMAESANYADGMNSVSAFNRCHLTQKAKGQLNKMIGNVRNARQLNPLLANHVRHIR